MKVIRILFLAMVYTCSYHSSIGQTSSNISKLFFDLPINSCPNYIREKIAQNHMFRTKPSINDQYIVSTDSIQDHSDIDSINLDIFCQGFAIGGCQIRNSPIQYELWLLQTIYLKNDTTADLYLNKQKQSLETFLKEPFINNDKDKLEYIYTIDADLNQKKLIQLHLSHKTGTKEVCLMYRTIFIKNECSCE
ncbi:MAG: hypothetical protein HYZ42_16745 [Bacteroidetes bacterium]|nr:hypothetical protein [Bacteroidota bacterium]